jgi:hypothetical protein
MALLLAIAAVAAADPPQDRAGFAWQAPSACPDAADVRGRIERRLGRPLDDVAVGISVDVAVEPTGYVARVDARAVTVDNSIRTLTSTRCDELSDAVAVIVARLATESHRVAAAEPAAWDDPPASAIATAASPAPSAWGGGVRALGLSGIGRVPSVGLGAELAGYLRHHDEFAELAVSRWTGRTLHLVDGAPGGVDVDLDVMTLRLGWDPEQMPLRAWVAGEVGSIQGSGVDLPSVQMGTARWVAAGAGFGVAWPMSPKIRLVGTFEVAVPFARPHFELGDGVFLYQPSWLVAHTALGLEIGWR